MKTFTIILLLLSLQLGFAQVRFQSLPEQTIFPERTVSEIITANIPYQGYAETQSYFGQGEYEIFLDTYNGILNKPIIILNGFDPGNSRSINDIYATLSFGGQNFGDILRSEGFDIVILNNPIYIIGEKEIDGGADYIQRNAMVLIALIQKLNQDKVGEEELVVIGPSMGGLVGQYALAYMENNNLEAQTRLFISFDAPHRGANIPISLQYIMSYFAEAQGDIPSQQIVAQILNSPAAKEMLVDHYTGHLLSGSTYEQDPTKLLPVGAPGFRNEFQAELDALGFPQNIRNVAMINGDANSETTGSPGMSIIDTNLTIDAITSLDIALKFGPEAAQTNIATDITLKLLGIPISNYQAENKSPNTTASVDSAPGGTASISDALGAGGGNPILIEFIDALQQDLYCFIPTMSSLAIDNPNWYAIPDLEDSPFDAFSISTQNEPHVTMNAEKLQFALDEIRNGVVGISSNEINNVYLLAQNPVQDAIIISVPKMNFAKNLITTVFSATGQKVMERKWTNPEQQIIWNHHLSKGFYFLKLDDGVMVQNIKMTVE